MINPLRASIVALLLSLLFLNLLGAAEAQDRVGDTTTHSSSVSISTDSLEARVDSLMAEYDSVGSPGAVVGVIRDGEVAFAKGYGTAELAQQAPITTETRFNTASVSKQFTGFAFALLEERDKLSLDDPVRKHLPSLPAFGETVTLKHLLTHTSGYREFFGPLALVGRKLASREEALEVVRRQPELEFPPGSKFQYNSSAYVLLTEIAERVTGQPFPEWMEENVFGPLEMENTTVKNASGKVVPNAASSYADAEDGGYREPYMDNAYYGSTDVYTTVGDLAKWLGNFQTAELGGEAVQEKMREQFVLTSGDTTGYGLGLRIGEAEGLRRVHHSGTKEGFRSHLEYYPELKAGVVVMANYAGIAAESTSQKIAQIAFGEHFTPKSGPITEGASVDPGLLKRYAGTYQAEDGATYVFETKEGRLLMAPPEMDIRLPLVAGSDTVFQMPDAGIRVRFHTREDGSVQQATFHGRTPVPLRRVEPWNPTAEDLKAYAGRYYSPEVEAIYTFATADSQLVAKHRWIGEMRFSPVAKDVFAAGISMKNFPPFRIQIRFERGEDGSITGYSSSIFRTSGVWFEKQE